jgi:hypothetical protein
MFVAFGGIPVATRSDTFLKKNDITCKYCMHD